MVIRVGKLREGYEENSRTQLRRAFEKACLRGFRLVSRKEDEAEFRLRPEGIFHLARIIYTHALATSQNSPRMFHAEINVPSLRLSENETACLEDSAECVAS